MYRKYGAKKIYDYKYGVFDSKLEYEIFKYLLKLQNEGEINDLQRQVEFELLPSQSTYKFEELKTKIRWRKTIWRPITYRADFTYYDKDMEYHVADAKGKPTPEYKLKKKLMLWAKGIIIEEWTRSKKSYLTYDINYTQSQEYVNSGRIPALYNIVSNLCNINPKRNGGKKKRNTYSEVSTLQTV